jgi:hypothetical protein
LLAVSIAFHSKKGSTRVDIECGAPPFCSF